jgi:hypothetical protein
MKTITDVIRLIGRTPHRSVAELTDKVYKTCKEHGLTTHNKNAITKKTVEQTVKRVISNIRHGNKTWKDWGVILSSDKVKLFKNDNVEFRKLKEYSLSEFFNVAQVRFEVQPILNGEPQSATVKKFLNCKDAKQYYEENKDIIVATRLVVGDKMLEVDLFE